AGVAEPATCPIHVFAPRVVLLILAESDQDVGPAAAAPSPAAPTRRRTPAIRRSARRWYGLVPLRLCWFQRQWDRPRQLDRAAPRRGAYLVQPRQCWQR